MVSMYNAHVYDMVFARLGAENRSVVRLEKEQNASWESTLNQLEK